jgi:hypothetical protein
MEPATKILILVAILFVIGYFLQIWWMTRDWAEFERQREGAREFDDEEDIHLDEEDINLDEWDDSAANSP